MSKTPAEETKCIMHNHNNKKEQEEILDENPIGKTEQEDVMSRPPKLQQPHPYTYPWLLMTNPETDGQVFCDILKDEYHIRNIPEFHNKFMVCCIHEWLVLIDYDDKLSLLNILTMEELQVPPRPITVDNCYDECGLWLSSKMDGNCSWRILFFDIYGQKLTSCQLSDTEYIEQELDIDDSNISAVACLNNRLYILSEDLCLFSADLPNHLDFTLEIDENSVEDLFESSGGTGQQNYLVESCGELLMVLKTYYDDEVIDISVFRADFNNRQWVRLENGIGDGVILLNDIRNGFSYSDAPALGLRSNSIYYLNDGNKNFYVYDIQDQMISTNLPCPVVEYESLSTWMFIPNDQCVKNRAQTSIQLPFSWLKPFHQVKK